ncbi:hypothetical protein Ciccas_004148 [Cichlidogyrus casuarinus]|uniref:Reverse transcriptase n=1 Tax=Cichlidogyrus casuarinus TaxID=1844966 RepID=A0ABD2QCG3_9PLAT
MRVKLDVFYPGMGEKRIHFLAYTDDIVHLGEKLENDFETLDLQCCAYGMEINRDKTYGTN